MGTQELILTWMHRLNRNTVFKVVVMVPERYREGVGGGGGGIGVEWTK